MLSVLVGGVVLAFVRIDRERLRTLAANDKLEEQLYNTRIAVAERELTQNHDFGRAADLLQECPERAAGLGMAIPHAAPRRRAAPTRRPQSGPMGGRIQPGRESDRDGEHRRHGEDLGHRLGTTTRRHWIPLGRLQHALGPCQAPAEPVLAALGITRIPATCVEFSPDGRYVAAGSFAPPRDLDASSRRGALHVRWT